jgi:hypothetical protein
VRRRLRDSAGRRCECCLVWHDDDLPLARGPGGLLSRTACSPRVVGCSCSRRVAGAAAAASANALCCSRNRVCARDTAAPRLGARTPGTVADGWSFSKTPTGPLACEIFLGCEAPGTWPQATWKNNRVLALVLCRVVRSSHRARIRAERLVADHGTARALGRPSRPSHRPRPPGKETRRSSRAGAPGGLSPTCPRTVISSPTPRSRRPHGR